MRFRTEFHRNGKLTRGINSTFIALIPKVDNPQKLNDFRPISLVGSMYKILAKVLANRLRQVVGSVVSEVQSAFVKERQILDGILVANEVMDDARKNQKELVLFKVDFEKAYDLVDWGYLDDVMCHMAFLALWRKWIKECVGTATSSVLVNGSPTDEFTFERGLRQGDPLSPFLFLLAAEGLSVMMRAVVHSNLFTGYTVGSGTSTIVSHLQFADDTLLIGVKSWANVRAMRVVLVLFAAVSGLKVNFHKNMLVGVNVAESWLAEAASVLGCSVGRIPFLYLGLPIGGDPRRLSFWDPIVNKIRTRLSGWNSRFLSFGGRLVLLKSVLTSLPVYALSFFRAPSGKWCWRMLVDKSGLWYRVLVSRYEMRELGWGEGGAAWAWRRQLWAWEEELLGELKSVLVNSILQPDVLDRWVWQHDPDGGYSVRGAYKILTAQGDLDMTVTSDLIWHQQVPLKVSVMAWRLLRNRLPTKDNLLIRSCFMITFFSLPIQQAAPEHAARLCSCSGYVASE
ncbi:hypothetical protein P8452_51564 [Trifolium repens]|nr:hypothetical protein P8452_51564 [Trifolium repens]